MPRRPTKMQDLPVDGREAVRQALLHANHATEHTFTGRCCPFGKTHYTHIPEPTPACVCGMSDCPDPRRPDEVLRSRRRDGASSR